MKRIALALALGSLLLAPGVSAQKSPKADKKAEAEKKKQEEQGKLVPGTFAGLAFREIGPALTSGRISDLAVHPSKPNTWYVAVASGGIWKTTNAGVTWAPVFDGQKSFSIGALAIDPNNPLVVWAGTGENNSQRSVAYGDGVYKSVDGGKSWANVGLGKSEHIGKIVVDPRDSSTVYVAAQGPLWSAGGDRGLYKTTDGGKTWKPVLTISEDTGVSDLAMDPRDPDVLYASAYQRRRHVWTLVNGGPEGGLHKSTDGGQTWTKLKDGLPAGDVGRIGLAIAPSEPDVVYAVVEASDKAGGFFRSTDAGASWEKRGDYVSASPQYYQEIFVDPEDAGRIYSMDVFLQVSEDGGKSFRNLGEEYKHVDNHALWIDPRDRDHLLVGSDGGLYETWDRGATWDFKANLPITQFYKGTVDDAKPFYNVYGGTQDNFSLGGPSRTTSVHGITNQDWFITNGGDGFQTVVDPKDPNVIYAQSQYGNLVRFDRKSGESVFIQPQPGKGEPALRWNWDSPLIVSPHSHIRLYFASNILFRSDDRGNTWRPVSPDLTRQIDRRKLKVMGRVWGPEAVAYNASTSFYGNIVALAESPRVDGLIYAGTDDGLVQVTEDGGANWRKVESFPGVPDGTYVSRLEASRHDPDVIFAGFNNHKNGDFKPYLLKSADRGRTWTSIGGDLPERGSVWALAEDHVDPNLLFAGTEFGAFFTPDGGRKWIPLTGGLPPIAVRDLTIQRRENDLVAATFGRGFYILDDYTPLRNLKPESLEKDPALFPVKAAWMYIEGAPLGLAGKAFQGHSFYTAPNPPFGAVFTYYLPESYETRKAKRQKEWEKAMEERLEVAFPSWDDLRAEDLEEEASIVLTVSDEEGNAVRRLVGPAAAGFHRLAWDLRLPAMTPVQLKAPEYGPFGGAPQGPLVAPGRYTVSLAKWADGRLTPIAGAQTFEARPLGSATFPAEDPGALLEFQQKTARLQRAALGALSAVGEAENRLAHVRKGLLDTPTADAQLAATARSLQLQLREIEEKLVGDPIPARHNEPTPPSILERVQGVVYGHWTSSTSDVTATQRRDYEIAAEEFAPVLADLRQFMEVDLKNLEDQLEAAGGPWTPGRLPNWQPE